MSELRLQQHPVSPGTELTPEHWERRKLLVGFGREDEAALRRLHLVARTYSDRVMEDLYARWLAFPELRAFFADDAAVQRVKGMQKQYFLSLTAGEYGIEYAKNRLHIGAVHRRIGLSPHFYMIAYSTYLQIVLPQVIGAFEYDRGARNQSVCALVKLVALDQALALESYFMAGAADAIPPAAGPEAAPPRPARGKRKR